MGHAELIQAIAREMETDYETARKAYDAVVTSILKGLAEGDEVRMNGFGRFVSRLHTEHRTYKDYHSIKVTFKLFESVGRKLKGHCPFKLDKPLPQVALGPAKPGDF